MRKKFGYAAKMGAIRFFTKNGETDQHLYVSAFLKMISIQSIDSLAIINEISFFILEVRQLVLTIKEIINIMNSEWSMKTTA